MYALTEIECLLECQALLAALEQHGTEYFTANPYWWYMRFILYLLTLGKSQKIR